MTHTFKNENAHLTATVDFGAEEITKASQKSVRKLCENVTVPGFRKGKAPLDKAQMYLKNEDVANGTIDELLKTVDAEFDKDPEFSSYIKENKFLGRMRPSVSINKFSNTEAEFAIVYVLRPTVTKLGAYKDLKTDVKEKEVTDTDVDAEIKKLAEDNAELVPQDDKAAALGDTTNIDFVGLMEGKEFDGGSAKGFDLELGSKHFVPGFEEKVVGHKAGEKFDIPLTMPDNYPAPLTSKPVVFKVTLNSVKVRQVPAINDEFATTLSGENTAKDLAELKGKVKARLVKTEKDNYLKDTVNSLLLQCRDASEFSIPKEYIDELVEDRSKDDGNRLEQQGLTLPEYLKLINKTEEAYKAELADGVTGELKNSLVYDAIAEAEKIPAPTQEDVEKRLNSPINDFVNNFSQYLKSQKLSDEQIRNEINGYINQIFSSIMSERVQAKVLALNGIVVPEEKKEEKPAEKPAEKAEEKPAEAPKADAAPEKK
jgi:trigger factor